MFFAEYDIVSPLRYESTSIYPKGDFEKHGQILNDLTVVIKISNSLLDEIFT